MSYRSHKHWRNDDSGGGGWWLLLVYVLCALLLAFFLSGCALFKPKGTIKSGSASVTAVADAGKPATLNTSDAHETLPIPAGSVVTITRTAAQEATGTAPAKPETEVTRIDFTKDSAWQKFDTKVAANTGTVDTSVAQKKIEVQAAQPLLYAAILSALAGVFFIYRAYPTPAALCGLSAGLFFVAWRTAGLPEWVWGLCALGLVAAGALYLGHERGQASLNPTSSKTT